MCRSKQSSRERAAVDDEPGEEGTGLVRVENVDFEHGDRVWPDRLIPEPIDAKLVAVPYQLFVPVDIVPYRSVPRGTPFGCVREALLRT